MAFDEIEVTLTDHSIDRAMKRLGRFRNKSEHYFGETWLKEQATKAANHGYGKELTTDGFKIKLRFGKTEVTFVFVGKRGKVILKTVY